MTIKAILFDHDGTLVDSEKAHYEMWKEILARYQVDLSLEEYNECYSGIPTSRNAKSIVRNHSLGLNFTELALAKARLTNRYLSKRAFPLMDGALDSIRFFHKKGVKIGIVTGAGKEGVKTTITEYGLSEYISTVVSGDDVKNSKPAPDGYLLATQCLGIKASDCLAIEDTHNGALSASSANIRCVGVSSSKAVRNSFPNTSHVCNNLELATRWISRNFFL